MRRSSDLRQLPRHSSGSLEFYADTFGGQLTLHADQDFGRTDGPPEAIAHGVLDGPISMAGSDAGEGQPVVQVEGLMLSVLGAAEPEVLHRWFDDLAAGGGRVADPLAMKPWGATDGQVIDRHGFRWLIGYETVD